MIGEDNVLHGIVFGMSESQTTYFIEGNVVADFIKNHLNSTTLAKSP